MSISIVRKIAVIACCVLIGIMAILGPASAAIPTPPPPPALPTPTPTPPSGGGGSSGGGGGYSTPSFNPYSVDVKSSDGFTVGNITAVDYFKAKLWAEKVLRAGNNNTTVNLRADLDGVPASPKLDIALIDDLDSKMPLNAEGYEGIVGYRITRSSNSGDWRFLGDTVFLTLTLPSKMLGEDDTGYCLVKNTSKGVIVYPAAPVVNNDMATFRVPLYYEAQSPTTSSDFVLAKEVVAAPVVVVVTPTPAPVTPTPAPTATPVPATSASIFGNLPMVFGLAGISLVVGAFAGMIVSTTLYRRYKRISRGDDLHNLEEISEMIKK